MPGVECTNGSIRNANGTIQNHVMRVQIWMWEYFAVRVSGRSGLAMLE